MVEEYIDALERLQHVNEGSTRLTAGARLSGVAPRGNEPRARVRRRPVGTTRLAVAGSVLAAS